MKTKSPQNPQLEAYLRKNLGIHQECFVPLRVLDTVLQHKSGKSGLYTGGKDKDYFVITPALQWKRKHIGTPYETCQTVPIIMKESWETLITRFHTKCKEYLSSQGFAFIENPETDCECGYLREDCAFSIVIANDFMGIFIDFKVINIDHILFKNTLKEKLGLTGGHYYSQDVFSKITKTSINFPPGDSKLHSFVITPEIQLIKEENKSLPKVEKISDDDWQEIVTKFQSISRLFFLEKEYSCLLQNKEDNYITEVYQKDEYICNIKIVLRKKVIFINFVSINTNITKEKFLSMNN